jgi:hypothetical protein
LEFFSDEKFLVPFIATLGASLTIIALQFISRYIRESRQRIYAATYMADVCMRLLHSEFILKKHTIDPHIEAAKKIIEGDRDLLETTLLSDEFDILTAGSIEFSHLPQDYKLLIGYDDIRLLQMFEMVGYLHMNESNRVSLNEFVKNNLKSAHDFLSLPIEKQHDILSTYSDYLDSLGHESNRFISFVARVIAPELKKYLINERFAFFSTSSAIDIFNSIDTIIEEYEEMIPGPEFFETVVKSGGIQSAM